MEQDTKVQEHVTEPLGFVDNNEKPVFIVKRHPAGIFFLYILTILGIVIGLWLIGYVLPSVVKPNGFGVMLITLLALASITISALFLAIATVVYYQSKLVLTDRNITQTIQKGLFNKSTSQLSMANVEDVTANQKGIFATFFDYGTLKIETAGEQANFHFEYCPRPRVLAKQVLEARERFIDSDPQRAHRANDRLHVPH